MPTQQDERLERAICSLEGLSVGDAFGEQFFAFPFGAATFTSEAIIKNAVEARLLPPAPWHYTDDTEMALSVVSGLRQDGVIDQDRLARSFSEHYDPSRGYGPAMHRLLPVIRLSGVWVSMSRNLFQGQGSFGNGAAMRVAPLGAYFADDVQATAENAARSAEVTHAHPEASAGAIATAVAAAYAWRLCGATPPGRSAFLDLILPHVPASLVRDGIAKARDLPGGVSVVVAMDKLGNGSQISAQDTVPFVLWCAGERLDNYEEALWLTVSGLGDRDTTCAMVGGIVSMYTGLDGIPLAWRQAREPLPGWPLREQSEM